jgi:hypothetical protein
MGVTAARDTVYGQAAQAYPGPLITFPQGDFGTLHAFTVPQRNYTITELIEALNNLVPPHPNLLIPVFDFVDDYVTVAQSGGLPSNLRVMSVIESADSSLAPLLGFQSTNTAVFAQEMTADTQPGLFGLVRAYLHIRPIATGNTVTVGDKQALEVSVLGFIPCEDADYGDFVQYDFSRSGDSYMIRFEDDKDLSRLQVRLRDHQGRLVQVGHPGIVLWLKVFLR